jgi:S-formylglutathione hydrolase FrmB
MKNQLTVLAAVICLLSVFVMETYAGGTVQTVSFFSTSLHTNRWMQIYLPEGYNPGDTVRYPVIYFLHGAGHNDTDYTNLFPILDSLIANHSIKPVIVVKPDGSVGPWDGSFYTNSALYGLFEDYIVYDVVSYVDSSFKTLRSRDKRCIMGHSMGGYGSMKLALKHPSIFRGAAAHSGPIDLNVWRNMCPPVKSENGSIPPFVYNPNAGATTRYVFTCAGAFSPNVSKSPYPVDFPMDSLGRLIDSTFNKWLVHNPARLAVALPPGSNLALYFDCGTQDELGCYAFNTGFRDSLHLLGLAYTWLSFTGSHWDHLPTRLPISLCFLDSVMNVVTTTVRNDIAMLPKMIFLRQNYPNPFNPETNFQFSIANFGLVRLVVCDLLGREVAILVNEMKLAGAHSVKWDASRFSSGVYFYKLMAGGYVESKKMVLIR